MGCRGRAVDGNLHALDGEFGQTVGGGIVDAAAIGLELERDAAVGENLEEFPAMRDTERLAAAEGRVRDAGFDDAPREVECLVAPKLVSPSSVGPGFLAARDATRAAAVGQLPGDEQSGAVLVNRAPSMKAARDAT
jgi:hypothetical protein